MTQLDENVGPLDKRHPKPWYFSFFPLAFGGFYPICKENTNFCGVSWAQNNKRLADDPCGSRHLQCCGW